MVAMIGFGFVMFLMGPSKILDLPLKAGLTISAFPFLGLFQVFVFIPIIPEMIERMQVKLNIREGEDEYVDAMLNDKCNDMYGLVYALSMFLGPLIGDALQSRFGYRTTCDVFAYINFGWALILFIFNCGPMVIGENKRFQAKLNTLKADAESGEQ